MNTSGTGALARQRRHARPRGIFRALALALLGAAYLLAGTSEAWAKPIWHDGEWYDPANDVVWVNERGLWWQRDTGHYWVDGWWRDGAGRYWTPAQGWFYWPEPEAVAAQAPTGTGVERWRPLVAQVFPSWAVDTVLRIMRCESGGDPNATGRAGERGLMQIHPTHFDSTYDPYGNLLAAYRISEGGTSWGPWSCR